MAYHSQTKCSDNLLAKTPAPVRQVDEVSSDEESADEVPGCFQLHLNSIKEAPRPIKVVVCLNSHPVEMEVDTGAAVTESVYQQHLKNVDLPPEMIQFQTYTNERLTILGK